MTYSTVRAATAGELTYLRTPGQWSKLYLAMFKPSSIYTARLNTLPTSNDRVTEISFTSGVGTLADVLPDMTLYVGSTAGAYDLGVARIRKAPIAGTFYIGEESDIAWSASCYLTVVNEYDLWAKHINTVSSTVFYMDTDITYTDQNATFSPIPIMGSHRVLKFVSVSIATTFNWTNSYVIDSTISAYSCSCPGATVTNGTTSTPTVTFTSTGWYAVYLTVTAANGKSSVGVRYVYVYSDANPPTQVFQLDSCSCDYDIGGWTYNVTMTAEVDLTSVPERTLCILFAEDYYGDTRVSLGQSSGSENILCVGKISDEAIDINAEQSQITLQIQGMQYWFSKVFAFPTGVLLTTSAPTNWAEMQSPTIDKVIFRLLHWGSTATKIMDVYLTNDTRIASELTSPASNLWAQIQEIAFATIYAKPGIDKYGRLFIEVEPQVVPVASRTWATVMTITKEDYHESVRMQRVVISPTGAISSSGVVVNSDGTGSALFSLSAGHVFKHYGDPEVIDRLLLSTQALSNQMAGLLLGWKNNQYPNTEIILSSNNRLIDCFPRQKLKWSLSTTDTPRGISFTDASFIPRRVEYSWDPDDAFIETSISMEMEGVEVISIDGDIPGDGDADLGDPPDPPDFPDLPLDPILTGGDIPTDAKTVVIYSSRFGILYTTNFNATSPNWKQMNGGLGQITNGTDRYKLISKVFVCPGGAVYAVRLRTISGANWNNGDDDFFIYRAPAVGQNFTLILNKDTVGSPPSFFDALGILGFGVNKTLSENVLYVQRFASDVAKIYVGASTSFSLGSTSTVGNLGSGGGDQAGLNASYGNGKWVYVKDGGWWDISLTGTLGSWHAVTGMAGLTAFNREMDNPSRGGVSPILYTSGDYAGSPRRAIIKSTDNFATSSEILTNDISYLGFAVDATGQYIMTRGYLSNTRYKSSDGGGSWSALSALPAGPWHFINAGSPLKFVAAEGTSVRYTDDGGSTWVNKEGNIIADFPITDIVMPCWAGV